MLTLRFESDKTALLPLYEKLGLKGEICGANFVFTDEGEDVGLWRSFLKKDDVYGILLLVDRMVFLKETDIGDRQFFFHAMLFKLQNAAPIILRIKGEHKELEPYGFSVGNGFSDIRTDAINLHPYCKG